ncbi:30S ribosomal protein 2 chloroplastic [Tripterygium wilfordii]|uniref:Small ribosomal subunit protein cS22 n=1 Tax=Tripterygium wilfordii TaxID=458696 RepID=A0A7J7E2B8_TRIWF|nr:30S ribosomal protein 2, chloroplastic [Tripterygium wilfordii]KAF5752681.1 30S ribosomal protein 2 chloroplastic [Tripterygium wilfordii]
MATMLSPTPPLSFSANPNPRFTVPSKPTFQFLKLTTRYSADAKSTSIGFSFNRRSCGRLLAVAEETPVETQDPESVAARRLYVGNLPRTVNNDELSKIVAEHGALEKTEVMYDKYTGKSRRFAFVTMKTVEDANAATEKLNGTQIGGREIKVNITEKPLTKPLLKEEESQFIDSPHKVYVGNLAKTVTTDSLTKFFSEKGNVLSAKVQRIPGTSKSSRFGFITFSSEEDAEAAISSFNNSLLEGQRIRVNKA